MTRSSKKILSEGYDGKVSNFKNFEDFLIQQIKSQNSVTVGQDVNLKGVKINYMNMKCLKGTVISLKDPKILKYLSL